MFENIIGNTKIKQTILKSIETKRTSHSYMFIGIEGIGKRLFAEEFAKQILCIDEKKYENKTYCNKCKSCIQIKENNNPDFIFIDIEDNEKAIKISQIRNLQLKIAEKPIISESKVYIINNADTMTHEAQNCLLKTLEEPPEYVTIILIGANDNNFLATIKSRCTKIYFDKISDEDIKKYLKEHKKINDVSDDLIKLCGGSISKSIHIKEKEELYNQIAHIVKNLDKSDIIDLLNMSEIIYNSKDDIYEILENLNILCLQRAKENVKMINCMNIIEDTKTRLKANSNYEMCIDNMIFTMWREVN